MGRLPDTVLVGEDDRAVRDLIVLALKRLDCDVIAARDGLEVLALARQHRPDVVLLDILLPQVNGLEVMRQLRELGGASPPRVIVISALGFLEVVQQAIAAGAADFIVKPFDVGLLVEKVRRALARSGP